MILLTAEGTLVSWGLSPVDTTSMQRSTFHKPSSNQAIRTVSKSCCTLCPPLGGPSGHVNERAIRSGITVVTLLSYTCKAPCPLLFAYRLRSRLCSGTTDLFSSLKLLQNLIVVFLQISFVRCPVLDPSFQIARHSVISLSPYEVRKPVSGFQIRLYNV